MSRFAEFNESRTFGVEIEFTQPSDRFVVERRLREAGINAQVEGYNHTTKNHWKIVTDASCGNELVSPILRGHQGLEEVKKVCAVLNSIGCKVDKRCGVHVHHYVGDLEIKNFRNLYIAYAKYENLIDSLMPVSRRGSNNNYCFSLIHGSYENTLENILSCKTLNDLENSFCSRYYKLNIKSYVKYGTIEFRQHSGSTDATKITNWIMFTQLMVERSKRSIVTKIEREYDHIGCLLNMLGIVRKATCSEEMFEMGKFFRKRFLELNKETSRAAA